METKKASPRKATFLFKTEEGILDAIKKLAAKDNRSVNNYIETIMKNVVKMELPTSDHLPNQETINSFKESKKDLKSYNNFSEMIDDL
ncbi:MAG: hypothetical protein ACRCU2_07305 [Planktothrix sp.]